MVDVLEIANPRLYVVVWSNLEEYPGTADYLRFYAYFKRSTLGFSRHGNPMVGLDPEPWGGGEGMRKAFTPSGKCVCLRCLRVAPRGAIPACPEKGCLTGFVYHAEFTRFPGGKPPAYE